MSVFSQTHFINVGLTPVADALAATKSTDIVNTKLYDHVTFILIRGVATGGTADHTLTVEACSDASGTGAVGIPFKSREGGLTGAALGALTTRAAAGYTNAAGSNKIDVIEVQAADTPSGKPFVRLTSVEVTDDPVVAAVLTILGKPRYAEAVMPDATV